MCSRAKVANVFTFVYAFSLGWLNNLSESDASSMSAKFWSSFGQPNSISLALDQIMRLERAELGLNGSTVGLEYRNYKISFHFIWMVITFIIYAVLAWYLDQVVAGEYGVAKDPCFCCKRAKRESSRVHTPPGDDEENLRKQRDPTSFEQTDAALLAQDASNKSIQVKDLTKVYPNGKLAVNKVSYSMYAGQIFALLGHNGAGKTSTISMITGLYPATSGDVDVFGMSVRDQITDIRKIMGVCPQHDILFETLTSRSISNYSQSSKE